MLFLGFIMLIPGPVAFLIYSSFVDSNPEFALVLSSDRKSIASLVAGFSFTMLGFLAAIITILFSFVNSESFRRYKKRGYLQMFFFSYFLTIICLVITSFLALANFSSTFHPWLFRIQIISFTNNIVQIALLTLVISNVARHASHET